MNQSQSISTEAGTTLEETTEPRTKYERLALARALVVAQFGPAALVDLEITVAPRARPGVGPRIAIGA